MDLAEMARIESMLREVEVALKTLQDTCTNMEEILRFGGVLACACCKAGTIPGVYQNLCKRCEYK